MWLWRLKSCGVSNLQHWSQRADSQSLIFQSGCEHTSGVLAQKKRPERLVSSCLTQPLFSVKFYSWKQDTYFYEMSINNIIKKLTLIMGKFLGDEQHRLWKEEPRDWEQGKEAPSICAACTPSSAVLKKF